MEPEIDLETLPAEEWREILASAAELDLVHGGYFRVRPGSLQFFAGPENAPHDWPEPFPDEEPARVLVGEAEVQVSDRENEVTVRLAVSNWAAVRGVKQRFQRGEYRDRFAEYVRDQESALRGRPADRQWLREQFRRLRRFACGSLVEED